MATHRRRLNRLLKSFYVMEYNYMDNQFQGRMQGAKIWNQSQPQTSRSLIIIGFTPLNILDQLLDLSVLIIPQPAQN